MSLGRLFTTALLAAVAAVAATGTAQAQPAAPATDLAPVESPAGEGEVEVDADGDGDVDADDRALLEAAANGAEQVEIIDRSEGRVLTESARAVTVIDTKVARERTADLGEVLSRAQGVQVRRSGGLGSVARISLNGLADEQIRFYIDGVPLDLAGWGTGVANVPVELVQRIDVHRGVVPISYGGDALGGAIDLVTDASWVNRAAASLQVGSFGTQRATVFGRVRDTSGLAAGLSLFADHANNDYMVNVTAANDAGQLVPVRVRRFHDGYLASGGNLELGVVDRGPVRRAIVRLFGTRYNKELQHDSRMKVAYGDVTYGESAAGLSTELRLAHGPATARLVAGIAQRRRSFRDVSTDNYNWFGEVISERPAGERTGRRSIG